MKSSRRALFFLIFCVFFTACSKKRGTSVVQGGVIVVPDGAAACDEFENFETYEAALEVYDPEEISFIEENIAIEVPEASDLSYLSTFSDPIYSGSSATVKVGIIDSGIDTTHPDLMNWIDVNSGEIADNGIDDDGNGFIDDVVGVSFAPSTSSSDYMDTNGHGTHVAGIVMQAVEASGLNTGNVGLVPIRFLNGSAQGTLAGALRAIGYAIKRGVHVINASWGSTSYSPLLDECVKGAIEAGIVFVAAAGNSATNNDVSTVYPSNTAGVISVAALNGSSLASFSNYGLSTVDIAAQGESIVSTLPGGGWGQMSGTSMASPYVAGVAAALYEAAPDNYLVSRALLDGVSVLPSLSGLVATEGEVNFSGSIGEIEFP